VDNQCAGRDAIFQANDTISEGTIINRGWDFTNNGIINDTGAIVYYTNSIAGNYTIKLECESDMGCVSSITKPNKIFNNPFAGFTYENTTTTDTTLFTNTSTIDNDSIIIHLWDFGDGVTSTLPDPSHLFENPGTYTVQLETFTNNFCQDTDSVNLIITEGASDPDQAGMGVTNNIITPNSDGINDKLEIANLGQYNNCKLTVFNRWNDQVYSGPAEPSEGAFNSFDAGVYYYILKCDGEEIMGSFNILK
jgi:gliding motility-associated-like protein